MTMPTMALKIEPDWFNRILGGIMPEPEDPDRPRPGDLVLYERHFLLNRVDFITEQTTVRIELASVTSAPDGTKRYLIETEHDTTIVVQRDKTGDRGFLLWRTRCWREVPEEQRRHEYGSI